MKTLKIFLEKRLMWMAGPRTLVVPEAGSGTKDNKEKDTDIEKKEVQKISEADRCNMAVARAKRLLSESGIDANTKKNLEEALSNATEKLSAYGRSIEGTNGALDLKNHLENIIAQYRANANATPQDNLSIWQEREMGIAEKVKRIPKKPANSDTAKPNPGSSPIAAPDPTVPANGGKKDADEPVEAVKELSKEDINKILANFKNVLATTVNEWNKTLAGGNFNEVVSKAIEAAYSQLNDAQKAAIEYNNSVKHNYKFGDQEWYVGIAFSKNGFRLTGSPIEQKVEKVKELSKEDKNKILANFKGPLKKAVDGWISKPIGNFNDVVSRAVAETYSTLSNAEKEAIAYDNSVAYDYKYGKSNKPFYIGIGFAKNDFRLVGSTISERRNNEAIEKEKTALVKKNDESNLDLEKGNNFNDKEAVELLDKARTKLREAVNSEYDKKTIDNYMRDFWANLEESQKEMLAGKTVAFTNLDKQQKVKVNFDLGGNHSIEFPIDVEQERIKTKVADTFVKTRNGLIEQIQEFDDSAFADQEGCDNIAKALLEKMKDIFKEANFTLEERKIANWNFTIKREFSRGGDAKGYLNYQVQLKPGQEPTVAYIKYASGGAKASI